MKDYKETLIIPQELAIQIRHFLDHEPEDENRW